MLNSLPVELLQHVTGYLEGVNIGLLWRCGSSRLNHRLGSSRGVIHFRLVLDPLFPSTWPSLIRNFELDSFVVEHRFEEYSNPSWTPLFSDLRGPKLEILQLSSTADMDAFCAHLESHPHAYPRLENILLCNLERLDAYHLATLGRALPSLRSLPAIRLDALVLSDLPQTLKHLSVQFETISGGCSFPDGLEKLYFSPLTTEAQLNLRSILPNLPLGLQSLHIHYDDDESTYPSASDISLLPRGLKKLELILSGSEEFSTRLLFALPPCLEVLKLRFPFVAEDFWRRDDYAVVKALPRTLTKLDFGSPSTIPAVPWLPPSLRWIQPQGCYSIEELNSFLPHLRSVILSPHLEGALPASITTAYGASLEYVQRYALPLGLKSLILHNDDSPDRPLNPAENLPPNLHDLTLSETSLPINSMPSCLVSLSISRESIWKLTKSESESLPRTLTSLELQVVNLYPSATEVMSRLPPLLVNMDVSAVILEVGCLKSLPCSKVLRNLRLDYSANSGLVTRDIVMSLPRKLAFCKLTPRRLDSGSVTDETLMNLPPGLCSLTIACVSDKDVLGTCKSQLPKPLNSLTLLEGCPDWFRDRRGNR